MQLNIAICDDDRNDCNALSSCLHSVCTELETDVQITAFSGGDEFLAASADRSWDIVFMDIYMDGISGTEAVRSFCSRNNCMFVFTTCSPDYALEAFSLNAVHYLIKPLTEASVKEALERCTARLSIRTGQQLKVKTGQGIIPIPMDNITYIEVSNKICSIHTQKNCFQTYTSLDALSELLDSSFFMRAQRSYVVNMHFIESFFFDHIVLYDQTEIVLSRNSRTELKKQYQQFLFHLARRGEV